jgi:hypothetical protein
MTLELPDNSPMLSMPWIITFGPMADDDEWEPVVCGPYEREHALGLAEEIVADEELTAVVEPLLPLVEVGRIREEIAVARALAEEEADEDQDTDLEFQAEDYEDEDDEDDEGDEDEEYDEDDEDEDVEYEDDEDEDDEDEDDEDEDEDDEEHEHAGAPSPDEIRAGFARIAARLTGG